jgi:hypothetical protein
MNQTHLLKDSDLQLISVLDETVNIAAELNLSESEVVSKLLERFHHKTDICRSAVHVNQSKKLFNGTAGP